MPKKILAAAVILALVFALLGLAFAALNRTREPWVLRVEIVGPVEFTEKH